MKKDDLIYEAIKMGLGDEIDLTSRTKSELEALIDDASKIEEVPAKVSAPKHSFYRG